jgi:hypothetical protein
VYVAAGDARRKPITLLKLVRHALVLRNLWTYLMAGKFLTPSSDRGDSMLFFKGLSNDDDLLSCLRDGVLKEMK